MTALISGLVVIGFALVMTKPGQDIAAATQHFMLYYAGVFALIGLTASVGVGLLATDRIVMTPGHRVMAQAVHRAVSFGALAFLVIHIVTEILAQRSHAIDAVIPFLSPYRTFYIGLGTIALDLILVIVVTSIWRKRFTAHGKAWRWRAIHYSSYLAFVFGVMHGLLGGRAAKPYVDWSYGFAIALTALAVVVRFLAISLRSKDTVNAPGGAGRAAGGLGYSKTSQLRSAALSMAQAQLSGTIQMMPSTVGAQGAGLGLPGNPPWAALPPPDWAASSGPRPALPVGASYVADPSLMPLGAPVAGDYARSGSYPYPAESGRQPLYEPEYDGPPRFAGAPRKHAPQDDLSSYPYAAQGRGTGPLPLSPPPRLGSGPTPRADSAPPPRLGTGPMPRVDTGPMPRLGSGPMPIPGDSRSAAPRSQTGPVPRVGAGPLPQLGTGPMPRPDTGPLPRLGSGPQPQAGPGPEPWLGSGPQPQADSGPLPRLGTGPRPLADSGPLPRLGPGSMPRTDAVPAPRLVAGLVPRPDTGPMPRIDSGPPVRPGTGPVPRADTGPMPRLGTGPLPRADSGSLPRPGSGSAPRPGTGPMPRPDTGPIPRLDAGPMPRPDTGPIPRLDAGPMPRPDSGPLPRADSGPLPRLGAGPGHGADNGSAPRPGSGTSPRAAGGWPRGDGGVRPGTGAASSPDGHHGPRTGPAPATATRRSRRTHATDPRRSGGDEWR